MQHPGELVVYWLISVLYHFKFVCQPWWMQTHVYYQLPCYLGRMTVLMGVGLTIWTILDTWMCVFTLKNFYSVKSISMDSCKYGLAFVMRVICVLHFYIIVNNFRKVYSMIIIKDNINYQWSECSCWMFRWSQAWLYLLPSSACKLLLEGWNRLHLFLDGCVWCF